MVFTLCAAVLVAGPATAQQPRQRGGGGPGGQGGPGGILNLLQNKDVQKELGIDQDDVDKVPDAVMEALGKVLKPEQMKRLKQIALQRRGNQALTDAKVQKTLKFTSEQKEQIETILKDSAKEMREMFGGGGRRGGGGGGGGARGGNREEIQKKITALNEATKEKIDKVLTPEQKKKWKNMLGQPFKFESPFGRGGRGGRGGRDNP
jgi:hypothetical protein